MDSSSLPNQGVLIKEEYSMKCPPLESLQIKFIPYEYGALGLVQAMLTGEGKNAKPVAYNMCRFWCSRDKTGHSTARYLEGQYPNVQSLNDWVCQHYEIFTSQPQQAQNA